jgi:hypothetical protein
VLPVSECFKELIRPGAWKAEVLLRLELTLARLAREWVRLMEFDLDPDPSRSLQALFSCLCLLRSASSFRSSSRTSA